MGTPICGRGITPGYKVVEPIAGEYWTPIFETVGYGVVRTETIRQQVGIHNAD